MRHRPELTGLDASQDLLGGQLLGAPGQRLQLLEGRGGRLLHDDVGAGVKRAHGQQATSTAAQ
jgi:hypothetical protein